MTGNNHDYIRTQYNVVFWLVVL